LDLKAADFRIPESHAVFFSEFSVGVLVLLSLDAAVV
jgi:hypothetical protein